MSSEIPLRKKITLGIGHAAQWFDKLTMTGPRAVVNMLCGGCHPELVEGRCEGR